MSDLPPANWYPDPEVPGQQRYWDGTQWTEHRAPGAGVSGSGAPAGDQATPASDTTQTPQQPEWSQAPAGASAPQWGQPSQAPSYAPSSSGPTNGMAIAALVLAIVWLGGLGSVAAVILGLLAIRQINAANGAQGGKGLAIAGTVIGGIGIVGALLFWVFVAFIGTAVEQGSNEFTDFFECIEEEARTGEDLNC